MRETKMADAVKLLLLLAVLVPSVGCGSDEEIEKAEEQYEEAKKELEKTQEELAALREEVEQLKEQQSSNQPKKVGTAPPPATTRE